MALVALTPAAPVPALDPPPPPFVAASNPMPPTYLLSPMAPVVEPPAEPVAVLSATEDPPFASAPFVVDAGALFAAWLNQHVAAACAGVRPVGMLQ